MSYLSEFALHWRTHNRIFINKMLLRLFNMRLSSNYRKLLYYLALYKSLSLINIIYRHVFAFLLKFSFISH